MSTKHQWKAQQQAAKFASTAAPRTALVGHGAGGRWHSTAQRLWASGSHGSSCRAAPGPSHPHRKGCLLRQKGHPAQLPPLSGEPNLLPTKYTPDETRVWEHELNSTNWPHRGWRPGTPCTSPRSAFQLQPGPSPHWIHTPASRCGTARSPSPPRARGCSWFYAPWWPRPGLSQRAAPEIAYGEGEESLTAEKTTLIETSLSENHVICNPCKLSCSSGWNVLIVHRDSDHHWEHRATCLSVSLMEEGMQDKITSAVRKHMRKGRTDTGLPSTDGCQARVTGLGETAVPPHISASARFHVQEHCWKQKTDGLYGPRKS